MPAYNTGAYIREAIESILNQSEQDFELIIVNDGSSDNSLAIISKYTDKDTRIRVINQKNMGLAAARNVGIIHAQSDFIAFMDSDDVAHTERLEKQFSFLAENPGYTIVSCLCELIDEKGKRIRIQSPRKSFQEAGLNLEELLRGQILVNATSMIRVPSLGWSKNIYRPWFRVLEDFDLSLRVAENHRIAHLNGTPLYKYRQYSNGGKNLMGSSPVLFWNYWCAAVLSAYCRRNGSQDPLSDLTIPDTDSSSFIPALATLPHPIKVACIINARHWCRRLLRQGMSKDVEYIIDQLIIISINRDDFRTLRKVLFGILVYTIRYRRWRFMIKMAGQLRLIPKRIRHSS